MTGGAVALLLLVVGPAAPAQIEEPEILVETPEIPTGPTQVDLANLVTSAAKSVTTVQEAPSIITVITGDEIKRRGFRSVNQLLTDIPGWEYYPAGYYSVDTPMVRGAIQAALLMHEGVSLFSPFEASVTTGVQMPLETVKRVEIVTGPGGVLWGANSFLGIVNVIGKDAEDVDGVEVDAGYGDGPGDQRRFRAYAMFGKVLGRLKLFHHVSYDSYGGPRFTLPQLVLSSPAPQPNGPSLYGSPLTSSVRRSWLLDLDGKITLGPVSLAYNLPFGKRYQPLTFPGAVVHSGLPSVVGPGEVLGLPAGSPRPYNATDATDPDGVGRDTVSTFFDRYAILAYRSRFWAERLGVDAKAYLVDFHRGLDYYGIFPPSKLLPGGLAFRADSTIRRFGGTADADITVAPTVHLLAGVEGFRESISDGKMDLPSPDPARFPFACPREPDGSFSVGHATDENPAGSSHPSRCPLTFVFDSDRAVVGGFVDGQVRLLPSLALDAGLRLQRAGGKRPYDTQFLRSGALVWGFAEGWHAKASYAEGFRPPVFNNTDSNGEAVQYAGSDELMPETSKAGQVEINARLLRGVRRVRELGVRADYSYTVLDHNIIVADGRYKNSGRRGIHNAELLAKLYLEGDHALSVSTTYIEIASRDRGLFRALPSYWLSFGAVFNVVRSYLDVNANLLVKGALDDPNRVVDPAVPSTLPGVREAYNVDLAFDHVRPVALLQVGVRARNLLGGHVEVAGNCYNLLDQRFHYQDAFYELAPRLEQVSIPGEGISCFAHAGARY